MTQLINLTPHIINIVLPDGSVYDVPVSGTIARCSQTETQLFDLELGSVTIPVTGQQFGEVIDLPTPADGVYYIVSRLVASACPDRSDLLVPGPLVRNEAGQPIGCRGLSRV